MILWGAFKKKKILMPGLHPRLIKSRPPRGRWGPGFALKAPPEVLMCSQGWNQGWRRSLAYCTFIACSPHRETRASQMPGAVKQALESAEHLARHVHPP